MAPVEPALHTFQVCPSLREELYSPLSRFVDLHDHPEGKTTIVNEFCYLYLLQS